MLTANTLNACPKCNAEDTKHQGFLERAVEMAILPVKLSFATPGALFLFPIAIFWFVVILMFIVTIYPFYAVRRSFSSQKAS